jgi:uncharacterized protein with PIN domain
VAEPAHRRLKDEEVVAVLVKVILEEGTVSSQSRLAELVNRQLRRRGRVTAERLRKLAVRSGLVSLTIRSRIVGTTPELTECPVCRGRLKRTANKTLTGSTTQTGYKCTRCPWWTGRELRVPHHYVFQAKVARADGGLDGQLAFVAQQRKL